MWLRTIVNSYEGMTWDSKSNKWGLMAIAAGTAAVFVSDLLTPLGLVLWVTYIPLCLIAFWQMGRSAAVLLAVLYSGLIVVGLFASPPGLSFHWAVINRAVGLCALWGALWGGEIACREWSRLTSAMRHSERFLRLVLEYLPDMVFVKDAADLRFVALNKAGENLLGLTNQELLGKTDYDFFPKAEADFFTERDRAVLTGVGLVDIGEETISTKGKGERVLHTKKVSICDEGGVPRYLLGLSEDITEVKNRESQDALRLRRLVRLSEVSLMIAGDPLEVFEQIVRTIGEQFDVQVVCLSEIVAQELRFKAVYVKGQVFRDAGGCALDITPCATVEQTKDLRVFDRVIERFPEASFLKDHQAYAYCGFPALDGQGHVVAVTCLLDDKPHAFTEEDQALLRVFGQRIAVEIERSRHLAERKQTAARLWKQESQWQALITALDDVVFEFDMHGTYLNVWTANEKLLFKPRGEILGRTIEDVLGREVGRPFMAMVARVAASGKMEEVEYSLEVSGELRWFFARASAIVNRDSELTTVAMVIRDISTRKQAEMAVQFERTRLRQVLDSQVGFVAVLSPDGLIEDVNQVPLRLMGLLRSDVIGRVFWEIGWIESGAMSAVRDAVQRAARGEIVRHDVEANFPAVGSRLVEAVFSPLLDETGSISGVIGFGIDVTDRKVAEKELRVSEERLRLALTAAKQGIYDLDLRTGIAQVSDEYATMLGYDPTTFKETNAQWAERMHPDDREKVYGVYEAYIRGKIPAYEVEFRQRMQSGEWKWVLSIGSIVERDGEGRPLRMLGTHTDISERKEREMALCASDARLQESQAMAKLGNWELDLVTKQLFWSDEIFRIFEIDQAKFAASYEGFLNAIYPDDRAMVDEAYRQSVQSHTPYMIVHRLLMQDGRVKHVMERGETFYDEQGQPCRSAGTVQDITVQRMAELQTEQALQEKEILLREIHHRVKNNLQLVSSLLYFQSKKVRSDEDRAMIHELQDRIKSMILVHEKLYRSGDLARIAFDGYLQALVDSVQQSYGRLRGKVEILLEAQPVTLSVDLALPIGLIVSELLTNAFKYAFPGDASGELRVRVQNGDGRMEVTVEDTGVGLPAGFVFQTAPTFGMQLMRGLAAQVGGTLTYESGRGTAGRLTVPLR